MGQIKIMSDSLANKIAAGEVVERPLSVVKELVENSIDANSKKIYIALKNGGIDYISVVDDGDGMDNNDVLMCTKRHASSKLTSDEMLYKIATLGFRGEALSSIAEVSKLVIETCDGKESSCLEIESGKVLKNIRGEFRKGTAINITKLFYNTPARLKYIKNLYMETAKIVEYIRKSALANPSIVFKLSNDSKSLLETSGSGNIIKTIRDLYSIEIARELQELSVCENDFNLNIIVAKPSFQRASKSYINIFVNKRVINSNIIEKVILESFKDFLPKNRYPFCIINIGIEPELIDVNIHPNKYEIKFSKEDEIKISIEKLLREFLGKNSHKIEYVQKNKEMQPLNLIRDIDYNYSEIIEEKMKKKLINNIILEPTETYDEKKNVKHSKKLYEPIGQFFKTYILAQNDSELVLIDQHAAMERINYEKNQMIFIESKVKLSELVIPVVITLSLEESLVIKDNIHKLKELKIDIKEFGNNDFIVRCVPSWIETDFEKETIELIIEKILKSEPIELLDIKDELIELMSCKESLKANTMLSLQEMEHIIDKLFECNNPYHCPHGRPIIVTLSIQEIEKMFMRVI
ncbi:MAG: DNA mismatch repair endonuclease MutL [Bacilli bacterium]